jgi:hypothetical protein
VFKADCQTTWPEIELQSGHSLLGTLQEPARVKLALKHFHHSLLFEGGGFIVAEISPVIRG